MNKFLAFLSSKTFFANLILAVLFFVLFFWGMNKILGLITHHNEAIAVPDLSNLHLDEASEILEGLELTFEVIDSSLFNPDKPLGGVTDQYPIPGSKVKSGRVILLTINPFVARKIEMPSIIEKTLRRALYDLESKGFVVGNLTYIPDIAKDVVLGITHHGKEVKVGDKFEKGTKIDLIVGSGLSNEPVAVPYFMGLTLSEARLKALATGFNIGVAMFDEDILDSALARVYRQNPQPSREPSIRQGTPIDLWFTNDSTKIPADSLFMRDSFYPEDSQNSKNLDDESN